MVTTTDAYLKRLLKYPSGLRAGGASPGPEVVASYWNAEGGRPFAFCRDGLLIDPDGRARFISFAEIEDSGRFDVEPLQREKEAGEKGVPLSEPLSLRLVSGEVIKLPLTSRTDGISERLTIATVLDRQDIRRSVCKSSVMDRNATPFDGERVARGRYCYGDVSREIELVRYPFDYHLELLDPPAREGIVGHAPNAEGYLFYLVPAEADPLPEPFLSPEAAKAWADLQPWGPVTWERNVASSD